MCNPCDQEWLFVLGTGRSGSTTLMDMLNLLPGVSLAGEDGGTILDFQHLREAYEAAGAFRVEHHQRHRHHQHQENGDAARKVFRDAFSCMVQDYYAQTMLPFDVDRQQGIALGLVRGFKEIRYSDVDKMGYMKTFKFLKDIFPCSKIVINWREDADAQMHSGFYANIWTNKAAAVTKMQKVVSSTGDGDDASSLSNDFSDRAISSGGVIIHDEQKEDTSKTVLTAQQRNEKRRQQQQQQHQKQKHVAHQMEKREERRMIAHNFARKAFHHRRRAAGFNDTYLMPLHNFNVAGFNKLLDWLGIHQCRYTSVLHDNAHNSYTHSKLGTGNNNTNEKNRRRSVMTCNTSFNTTEEHAVENIAAATASQANKDGLIAMNASTTNGDEKNNTAMTGLLHPLEATVTAVNFSDSCNAIENDLFFAKTSLSSSSSSSPGWIFVFQLTPDNAAACALAAGAAKATELRAEILTNANALLSAAASFVEKINNAEAIKARDPKTTIAARQGHRLVAEPYCVARKLLELRPGGTQSIIADTAVLQQHQRPTVALLRWHGVGKSNASSSPSLSDLNCQRHGSTPSLRSTTTAGEKDESTPGGETDTVASSWIREFVLRGRVFPHSKLVFMLDTNVLPRTKFNTWMLSQKLPAESESRIMSYSGMPSFAQIAALIGWMQK